jgi:lysophospholipase-2
VKLGRDLWGTLLFLGMDCVRKDYKDGGHWINEPEGMDDIVRFLERNA